MTIKSLYPTVRPTLNLNFARTKALDPRVTFTRASTATFVGSNGLIQTAASNAARFDHNPATGESLGLLVEQSRTNYVTTSENLTGWFPAIGGDGVTPTAQNVSATAPNNGSTVTEITLERSTANTSNYSIYRRQFGTTTVSTGSVYLKAARPQDVGKVINFYCNQGAPLDIANVTLTNAWQRVSSVGVGGTVGYLNIALYTSTASAGEVKVLAWGAQLEAGSFPTSYIPTTGSTVTCAADVATVSNTGSSIFPTSAFTVVNSPFGTAGGGSTVKLVGPTVKRTAVYNGDLTQTQINALAGVNDDFWRWRVLGTSFALPNFTTNGSVTVDWGDGVVETLTTAVHTFTNGGGYHDIGFRLNSGTFFKPNINNNATYKTRVIATGPAPASMKVDAVSGFYNCTALKSFDATLDATGGTILINAWNGCSALTSFPLINTATVTNFQQAWLGCSSLTSFPLLNTAAGTIFWTTWRNCSSLTSFPLLNTAAGTDFREAWQGCSGLTSFPLINTAAGTNFVNTWNGCSSLTSFPLLNTAAGTSFAAAWANCSSLTSFPLINTAAGTDFYYSWGICSSLTSFPLLNTAAGTRFQQAWQGCTSLTSFPLIDTSSGTNFSYAWYGCSSLTSFPLIDTAAGTNFFRAWYGCSSLTSFPLIDVSSGTDFENAWYNCNSLTSFPAINFSSGTKFTSCWINCTSLTSFSATNFTAITASNAFDSAFRNWASFTGAFPQLTTDSSHPFSAEYGWNANKMSSFGGLTDATSVTKVRHAWEACINLTAFPYMDFANCNDFSRSWKNCSSLVTFPANVFDNNDHDRKTPNPFTQQFCQV
jgi:hypothetical protein